MQTYLQTERIIPSFEPSSTNLGDVRNSSNHYNKNDVPIKRKITAKKAVNSDWLFDFERLQTVQSRTRLIAQLRKIAKIHGYKIDCVEEANVQGIYIPARFKLTSTRRLADGKKPVWIFEDSKDGILELISAVFHVQNLEPAKKQKAHSYLCVAARSER
jgi:hypothetical protein